MPRIEPSSRRLSRISPIRRRILIKASVVRKCNAHGFDFISARIAAMVSAYVEGRPILFGGHLARPYYRWDVYAAFNMAFEIITYSWSLYS